MAGPLDEKTQKRARLRGTLETGVCVFDDESSFEPSNLTGQTGELDRVQDGVEILVGGRRFVLRILAAVGEDVVRHEFIVHGLLIQGAVGSFASHATAGAMILPNQRTQRLPGLRSVGNICLQERGEGLTW